MALPEPTRIDDELRVGRERDQVSVVTDGKSALAGKSGYQGRSAR
jgi:hypothetical protein